MQFLNSTARQSILHCSLQRYSAYLWNNQLTALSQSLLKLPDVPRFLSEDKPPDGDNCEDWVEQFELVAELEGLGVVWAIKHFFPYLYGHHCDVFTDHEALKALMNTPQPSGRSAKWVVGKV